MPASTTNATDITLTLGGGSIRSGLYVEAVVGEEALSQPYAYRINFRSDDPIKPSDVIGKGVSVTVKSEAGDLPVHGVALEFGAEDPLPNQGYLYVVLVVPQLKLLDLTRQNQVYGSEQKISVRDLIDQEMKASLAAHHGHSSITHELNLNGTYREREFIVQYEETDLTFLSRWCEGNGIFYFFKQADDHETVVFGDANTAFVRADTLPYRRGQYTLVTAEAAVTSFGFGAKAIPETVILRDYNPVKPALPLFSKTSVSGGSLGTVVQYGQNYLEPDEGDRLAKIRAEEIACRATVFQGESNAPQLRPGYFFTLKNHPSLDDQYLVTRVTHEVVAPAPAGYGSSSVGAAKPYGNVFEAIPLSVAFRPERKAPRPVIPGLFTAFIDGEDDGTRAEIDGQGRYKVRIRFDEGTHAPAKASDFFRKAEPYAGPADTGMHFPLLKGTEVLLCCVNGDIDRPIILGAVANPLTPNVATERNHTFNRFRSPAGTMLEMNDGVANRTARKHA
ncbi:type VI secretion system Vgr family protein [Methylobacterium aerolatum]|uniref:Type VI secretion system VgrG family protein n=1 Tax=Methylobacterium aerolatum TaxID=418708 RepID=A0ABU0HX75_9HYPH|nr:type VI secretion system tip protein TssI/VgrG [Methylobacterium aerolatum]MDQ0446948.1 type VI secretion system VgrG family protein [Methylobacterium aerolatum]